jgi:hypothetical protein
VSAADAATLKNSAAARKANVRVMVILQSRKAFSRWNLAALRSAVVLTIEVLNRRAAERSGTSSRGKSVHRHGCARPMGPMNRRSRSPSSRPKRLAPRTLASSAGDTPARAGTAGTHTRRRDDAVDTGGGESLKDRPVVRSHEGVAPLTYLSALSIATCQTGIEVSTGYPCSRQALITPASGRTRLNPSVSSLRAVTAADASFGQSQ